MKVPSNLRRSSRQIVHRLEFSNTINDPIEVEEMGNTPESSEQGFAYGVEALGEEDSIGINIALGLEMEDDSSNERTIAFGEG